MSADGFLMIASSGMSGRLVLVIVLLSAAVVALAIAMLVLTSSSMHFNSTLRFVFIELGQFQE
jgi:hypothetical protein